MSSVLDYLTPAERRKLKVECAVRAAHQEHLADCVRERGDHGATLLDRAARYYGSFLPPVIDGDIWGGPQDELVLKDLLAHLKIRIVKKAVA